MKTKETQGKLWSTAPKDWANFLEPTFIPLYREVLKRIPLTEKTILLDAGCGSGLFLSMASVSGAKVYGIDAAPGLLTLTKKRLPQGIFLVEDIEEIPFPENSFDLVTAFNSLQYAGDKMAALKQIQKLLRPGGKIVLGLWDEAKNCDASRIFSEIAALLPPPPADAPGPFALSAAGSIEKMSAEIKLTLLHQGKVYCPWLFNGLQDLYKAFMCTGPAVKAAETLGEAKVKEIIEQSARPYRLTDEIYFMNNYFNFFIFQK